MAVMSVAIPSDKFSSFFLNCRQRQPSNIENQSKERAMRRWILSLIAAIATHPTVADTTVFVNVNVIPMSAEPMPIRLFLNSGG